MKTTADIIKEKTEAALRDLMEYADSVRIFVTFDSDDSPAKNTQSYESGGGNYYAQLGQVNEWLSIQDQYQRNYAVRKDVENTGTGSEE